MKILFVMLAGAALVAAFSRGDDKQQTRAKTEKGLYRTDAALAPGAKTELATFGGGCFWGFEEGFRRLDGVVATAVGFSGGHDDDVTYLEVCSGETGHAEVVQIEFDPKRISYQKLVETFFEYHDPTQLNRQGPDFGTQYRSIILTHSDVQAKTVETVLRKLIEGKRFDKPIVTEVRKFTKLHFAEEYHQQYVEKGGICHVPGPKKKGR